LANGEGIVVSGSGGGINLLLAESSPDSFPWPYRVLYHAVDLSARWSNDELVSVPVDEGSLLFTMVNKPDAPIPEGYYMQDFLRRFRGEDRVEIRHAIDRLEREGYVVVQRPEGKDILWLLTPTASARNVIGNWRRIRMQHLEHVGRSLQDELTAQSEAAAKRAATVQKALTNS
jgi:DNA-binding MarR family transcriptional regulator